MTGARAAYSGDVFRIKALYGKPLINVLPPTLDRKDRRHDALYAVNPGLSLGQHNLDLNYMMNALPGGNRHYSSIQFMGTLPLDITYNTELAAEMGTGQELFFSDDSRHAAYASLSWSGMNAGALIEFKDYSRFFLGSGFNDPPNLVKEHSYKVLNRATHISLLGGERGFQAEFYYRFEMGQVITLNTSRARNETPKVFVFSEYFAEFFTPFGESATLKLFADYSSNPLRGEENRYAAGGIWETSITGRWSGLLEAEYQYFEREFATPPAVHNTVVVAGISKGSKFSASITWESSTDVFETDNPETFFEVETDRKNWIGMDIKYRFGTRHTLILFAGSRRGGPSCTSGICYEVPDFSGTEVRLTSKF